MTREEWKDLTLMEAWIEISPYVMDYLVFLCFFLVLVVTFTVFVFIQVIKGFREVKKMRKRRMEKWRRA
ncbi:hypothetical protein FZC84_21195 [Rossellomorea vietnamensis]|uniref:Uncharacterized protein n=1 Tax=Rossellomorea vietnamensis TaxID=218284 RepID=A0A5D4M2F6_9BACI|nr:hypothetical protein [Rossellomorea vietnamensis]TYR95711.1 hypothetical protein FZC84_21195 [Rossellomorea vietnamensis]